MAIFLNSLVIAAVVFLLMAIDSSLSATEKRNLLSGCVITDFSPTDAQCCDADAKCSDGTPVCAVDDDLKTVWRLKNGTTMAYIYIQLNSSSLLSDISVNLSPTSVIPTSILVTTLGTNITWVNYFNETCQPSDDYLRRKDSKYYRCQRSGQNLTVPAPDGLFSIRNGSDDWLWWETFNQFQLTIEATEADYSNPNTSGSIEIADVRLYGWDEPRSSCNCHPVGVTDDEEPCSDGECNCKNTTTPNSQCIPNAVIVVPNYGPVSGGTIFFTKGNYLANATNVTLGDNYDCYIIRNNATSLQLKTSAGSDSDLHSTIPARIYWERPQGVVSFIVAGWEFTYRPDPVINSIYPRTSIKSGGIPQTVSGENLDSVAFPFITLVIQDTYFVNFTTGGMEPNDWFCHHINSTRLECISPVTETYGLYTNELTKITISMDIDKYNDYQNCEIIGEDQCRFLRTEDPDIVQWSEEMVYNVYDGKKSFQVQGNGFQDGSRPEDYSLTVEGVRCEIISVVSNIISFYPPDPSNFTSVDKAKQTILTVGYYSFTVGYIKYYLSWIDNPVNRNGLIIGLVCGVGGVIIIILAIVLYRTYYKKRQAPPAPAMHYNLQETRYTRPPQRDPSLLEFLKVDQRSKVEKLIIEPCRIQIEEEIGSGNFGEVYRGRFLKSNDEIQSVAIKTIRKNSVIEFNEKVNFLEEATIMIDFNHINVLSLIAVYIEDGFPYVVLPLMEHGDLREFVSKPDKLLTGLDLASYSLQVAQGMEYLAENKFVHRDLAARNCMINKTFVVKVADFGLARDIYEKDYYRPSDNNKPLPVKWMAIECLSGTTKFTESSDVWSFGVLMWELFTRGRKPYADIDNLELKRFLLHGRRLGKSLNMPGFIYDLMLMCWKETPTERPCFKKIVAYLQEIMSYDQEPGNEHRRASVASVESVDETANANQIQLHIERHGTASYINPAPHGALSYHDQLRQSVFPDDPDDDQMIQSVSRYGNHTRLTVSPDDRQMRHSVDPDDDQMPQPFAPGDDQMHQSISRYDNHVRQTVSPNDDQVHQSVSRYDSHMRQSVALDDDQVHQSVVPDDDQMHQSVVPDDDQMNQSVAPDDDLVHQSVVPDDDQMHHSVAPSDDQVHQPVVPDDDQMHQSAVLDDDQMRHSVPPDY